MEITVQELKSLNKDSYQIIDIRSEEEVSHGALPEAVNLMPENIEKNPKIDFNKKLVICCSRGQFSEAVAETLCEKGLDAVSLEGGYIAWIMDIMSGQEGKDQTKGVEQSLRKKFRKTIWARYIWSGRMILKHGEITMSFISFSAPVSLLTPARPVTTRETALRG